MFVSYAREDRGWVEQLRRALRRLVGDESISVWDDSYMQAGADWRTAICRAMERARVVIALVSDDFCKSSFIRSTELNHLCERAARGETVLLWMPVDGTPAPDEINQYSAVGDPERPLTGLSQAERDATMSRLARAVEESLRGSGFAPELFDRTSGPGPALGCGRG